MRPANTFLAPREGSVFNSPTPDSSRQTRRRPGVRAVVFDLDGVLVDTDRHHYRSWQHAAEFARLPFDRELYDARMRGLERMSALDALLEQAPGDYSWQEKIRLAEVKNRAYFELLEAEPPQLVAGSIGLLNELRRRELRIAVGSSSKNAKFIIRETGLEHLIDAVADGFDGPSKPDPKIFLRAAERLAVRPQRCLVVEDSRDGVVAAEKARMAVFGIGPPERFPALAHHALSLRDVTADQLLLAAGQR